MTTISAQTRLALAHRHQAGLSLVELMISIVIGLLLLAGISSLIAAQGSARGELEKAARQIVRAVQLDKRRALIGPDAKAIDVLAKLPPGLHQRLVAAGARRTR